MAQTSTVCIVGGGISGAALAWSFATAQQQQGGPTRWEVTVMHDEQDLGGHASSYPVEYQGTTYNIDLGVQMIAPVMYPNTMCMLEFPEFATVSPTSGFAHSGNRLGAFQHAAQRPRPARFAASCSCNIGRA